MRRDHLYHLVNRFEKVSVYASTTEYVTSESRTVSQNSL